jgi:hypothetical protein
MSYEEDPDNEDILVRFLLWSLLIVVIGVAFGWPV